MRECDTKTSRESLKRPSPFVTMFPKIGSLGYSLPLPNVFKATGGKVIPPFFEQNSSKTRA